MGTPLQRPSEAFRVNAAAFWVTILVAPLLQAVLPVKIPFARHFDFPLLATIYFASVRRNKVFGIVLGTMLGLLQDALSHSFIGIFGIAKAVIGYLAASASIKFNLEQLGARLTLAGMLILAHNLLLQGLERALLESLPPLNPLDLFIGVLVNIAFGLVLFQILDRFKEPS
jgi:rod shape-determining protein MreD